MKAIKFGDDGYKVNEATALIDSGSSCIVVPDIYFEWILTLLIENWGFSYTILSDRKIYVDNCQADYTVFSKAISKLPTIYFLIGDYWYQSDPWDYVLSSSTSC